jgi:hypothetical protein
MRMNQVRGRALALGVAAVLGTWGAGAEAVTYNVTIVQFEAGTEEFNGLDTVGTVNGRVYSSNLPNLPINVSTSSASYLGSVGQGFGINGEWALSDGSGNTLSGTFENLNRFGAPLGGPLARGTGTSTITGGLGAFENATGSGTFEVFARDFFGTNFQYEQVVVNRLQITVPTGDPQTDNGATQSGQNVGGLTSDDSTGLPRLTEHYSQYEYGPPSPHQGQSELRNAAGDAQNWTFQFPDGHQAILPDGQQSSFFFVSHGTAQMVNGAGFYEGYTGQSDWIAFEAWMTQIGPDLFTYSNVAIDRYALQAPIPEPETYLLMFAGLAFVGFVARRRLALR